MWISIGDKSLLDCKLLRYVPNQKIFWENFMAGENRSPSCDSLHTWMMTEEERKGDSKIVVVKLQKKLHCNRRGNFVSILSDE